MAETHRSLNWKPVWYKVQTIASYIWWPVLLGLWVYVRWHIELPDPQNFIPVKANEVTITMSDLLAQTNRNFLYWLKNLFCTFINCYVVIEAMRYITYHKNLGWEKTVQLLEMILLDVMIIAGGILLSMLR